MNVKLYTNFIKGIVSKIVSKMIAKKIGYKVNIQINELQLTEHLGEIKIVANVEGKMNTDDFLKLVGIFEEDAKRLLSS